MTSQCHVMQAPKKPRPSPDSAQQHATNTSCAQSPSKSAVNEPTLINNEDHAPDPSMSHDTPQVNVLPNVTNADCKSHASLGKQTTGGSSTAVDDKIAHLKAGHASEVAKLKAQVAQGRAEYEKLAQENLRLKADIYDLKLGTCSS